MRSVPAVPDVEEGARAQGLALEHDDREEGIDEDDAPQDDRREDGVDPGLAAEEPRGPWWDQPLGSTTMVTSGVIPPKTLIATL
jgi:hypothetical protein